MAAVVLGAEGGDDLVAREEDGGGEGVGVVVRV